MKVAIFVMTMLNIGAACMTAYNKNMGLLTVLFISIIFGLFALWKEE